MSDIPEDVMKRARVALAQAKLAEYSPSVKDKPAEAIARALMEERERAAKICECNFDSEMRSYGDWFAKEIRGQP